MDASTPSRGPRIGALGARCALRTVGLLARRRVHLHRRRVGATVVAEGGRRLTVFRETTSDAGGTEPEVTLLVWFHLRGTTAASPWRAWLFERESLLNTLLFAGCVGYERKLWMVERASGDYAGLYAWRGRDAALAYGAYITAVLRPLSTPGSVSARVVDGPLDAHLRAEDGPTRARELELVL